MALIDQNSLTVLQPELLSGETVLWTGRPSTKVIFHRDDLFLIPFSLYWGGFSIFWELGAIGFVDFKRAPRDVDDFMLMLGILFVAIGQYLIWGRFLYAAWMKRRIHYGVTNRRIIAVQESAYHRTNATFIDTLSTLIKERGRGKLGSLRFTAVELDSRGRKTSNWNRMSIEDVPVFVDIEDPDAVYHLVAELRDKSGLTKPNAS